MSDTESVDYLLDGFDPKSLTVPRLRSILVTHNVQYPATAKKQDLIDLFIDHVVPQSKKILAARARAKRSSMGITNADSQSTTSTDFDEDIMRPPPSAPRARSPRKSTRVKSESVDPEPAPLRESPRKRQSRSASTQLAPTSDTETADTLRSGRRSQRSTPAPKLEPPEEESFFKRTPETEGVFSTDNPFQSGGSSPPAPIKTPSNRRKTTGMESGKLNRTPSAGRRRTDGPTYEGHDQFETVSKSFEMPISRISGRKTPELPLKYIEPGEEFTPEEQLALDQEEQANPQLALARRKPSPTQRGSALSTPIWVLATTLLVAYAAWYRQEKVAVGYCGLGRDPGQLIPASFQLPGWAAELASKVGLEGADVKVPEWAIPFVEPECEPCPPHAYCYEDFTVRCEPDFILKPHPLSLGGLVPLPPTCEPDGEKVRRVQAVADKAVEELRDRRAKFECGEPAEPEGAPVDSPSLEEEELKEVISQKRAKRMNAEEFDDLWVAAIGEVKAREEVHVEEVESPVDETGGATGFPTTRLSSTSLARVSYTCAIQRSLKLGLARHRLSIGGLVAFLLSVLYGKRRFQSNRALAAKVPALVDQVLDRLANQKELAFEDGDDDAFLFLPNLRDDVLRSMHSLADRDRLWQRVRAVVEQNSNVRTGQRESHNGEVGRAWEWIGPSRAAITEGGSTRRRKSARVSFGPDVKGEPENVKPSSEMVERVAGHRKWEESRPIY
ncbi:Man1-Src1p-C-terminal domain-containing protein [Podospora aff. communis PSN243]|uniref:Man1-Src1p-C-terminal domain-containing protein n=1 Tax=Podospora aff. communis PSN243 TaxID=3040156 RepID=A0AAV9GWD4_9PEZI|nr:Man1-Src1p-C-terminal domain-containing protein [Podospora aff. communis PSN243]